MATSFLTEILARHAAEIEAEIETRTTNIMAELQGIRQLGSSVPSASKPARVAITVIEKKGVKRPPEEIARHVELVFNIIKAHPGLRIEKLSEIVGLSTTDMRLPIQKLRAENRIVAKGQKRATTYRVRG